MSNYPIGSDTPDAPWNQQDLPELTFNVVISQTLSKSTTVITNDYIEGEISEEADHDDEGVWYTTYTQDPPDTSNTNWKDAYFARHSTPLELIAELKRTKEREIQSLGAQILTISDEEDKKILLKLLRKAHYYVSECKGWVEDECEIIKD